MRNANLDDLRGALTDGRALVEFRQYSPSISETGVLGAPHWAAIVVKGYDRLEVRRPRAGGRDVPT